MKNKKVLVIGASGQVGEAVALALAKDNKVTGVSRFSNEKVRQGMEAVGVRTIIKDLADGQVEGIKDEYYAVFNEVVDWPGPPIQGKDVSLNINGYLQGHIMEKTPSAIHIYGSTLSVPYLGGIIVDELSPAVGGGVYGSTKLVGEALTTHLSKFRKIRAAILRYMWPCAGHRLRSPADAILDMVRGVIRGDKIKLSHYLQHQAPDGARTEEIIDNPFPGPYPLYIDDVVSLTIKAVEIAACPPETIQVFGRHILRTEIIKNIEEIFGVKANVEIVRREPLPHLPYFSREKMLRLLGDQTTDIRGILQSLKNDMEKSGEICG